MKWLVLALLVSGCFGDQDCPRDNECDFVRVKNKALIGAMQSLVDRNGEFQAEKELKEFECKMEHKSKYREKWLQCERACK